MKRTRGSRTATNWGDTSIPVPGDVLKALDELGISVVRLSHEEAWALCPGHEARFGRTNRHANKWSVNIETGQHSCFSCGFSGSFITLVQEVLDVERYQAEEWVRNRGGIERVRRYLEASTAHQPEQPRRWNEARLALFTDPPVMVRDGRRISQGAVNHYGVLWDTEESHWILPIRDPDTYELLGYQEKSEQGYFNNKPAKVPKSETLFGIDVFEGSRAVLLESPLDCLRLHSAGIGGGLASYGAKVSKAQMELLLSIADVVTIALDNDSAGIEAARKIKHDYITWAHRIRFINYHGIEGKDIGESTVTDKQIQHAVLTATPLILTRL